MRSNQGNSVAETHIGLQVMEYSSNFNFLTQVLVQSNKKIRNAKSSFNKT